MTRSPAPRTRSRRRSRLAGAALAALVASTLAALTALVAASTAAAAPVPGGLSITMSDGLTQVHSNTDVTYSTKVANAGIRKVTARLVLATPAYATIIKAPGAKSTKHQATWTITVPAGRSVTRTASTHIATIAKNDLRVTTLASVYLGKATSGAPLIRAADADRIAGVTDPVPTVPDPNASASSPQHQHSGPNLLLVLMLPIIGGVLLALGGLWWLRRRRAARPSDDTDTDTDSGDLATMGTGRHSGERS